MTSTSLSIRLCLILSAILLLSVYYFTDISRQHTPLVLESSSIHNDIVKEPKLVSRINTIKQHNGKHIDDKQHNRKYNDDIPYIVPECEHHGGDSSFSVSAFPSTTTFTELRKAVASRDRSFLRILITYSKGCCNNAAYRHCKSAVGPAGFDLYIHFSESALTSSFKTNYSHILSQKRGAGYWVWKGDIISQSFDFLQLNDVVVYADTAMVWRADASKMVDGCLEKTPQQICGFSLCCCIESGWTKRDAFILMDMDSPKYSDTFQLDASISVWRVSAPAHAILNEYLELLHDERLVTDKPNTLGMNNYAGFTEHRHDQSVLSLLLKKHKVGLFRAPTNYGSGCLKTHEINPLLLPVINRSEFYTELVHHHKRKT